MTTHVVYLVDAGEYSYREYGIKFTSAFVYATSGRGFHNPGYPHRFKVWDNTVRPNTGPNYGPDAPGPMGHGKIGEGKYVSPERKGTDDEFSFLVSTESVAITNSGTNTGTAASGQVWSKEPSGERTEIAIGDVVVFAYLGGVLSEPFKLAARSLDAPRLVPMT